METYIDDNVTVRFNMLMRQKMYAQLVEIMQLTGSTSLSDVVRTAINDYYVKIKTNQTKFKGE